MIFFTTAYVVNIFWLYVFNFLNYVECFLHVIFFYILYSIFLLFFVSYLEIFFPFHLGEIFLNSF